MSSFGISSIIASILMIIIVAALGGTTYFFVAGSLGTSTSQSFMITDTYNDTVTISNTGTDPISKVTARVDNIETAVAVAPDIPGLVGYWSFNDETNPTTDSSNNQNHGNINGATFTDGRFGKALEFEGSLGQYVLTAGTMDIPEDYTMAIWIKGSLSDQIAQNIYPFTFYQKITLTACNQIQTPRGGMLIRDAADVGFHQVWDGTNVLDDKWHHWAGTVDRLPGGDADVRIYLDGQEIDYGNIPDHYSGSSTISIGSFTTTGGLYTGKLDEAQIYSRALEPSEIEHLSSGLIGTGQSGTIKFLTQLDRGKHTVRICTPSMCTRGTLTIT
jgi:FlaG/FlaF family flagellin (archaellin)